MPHLWIPKHLRDEDDPQRFTIATVGCSIEGCRWTEKVKVDVKDTTRERANASIRLLHDAHLRNDHAQELRNRGGMVKQTPEEWARAAMNARRMN